jgi:hypothetical protein
METDGTCPTCGRPIDVAGQRLQERVAAAIDADGKVDVRALAGQEARTPWHFKLLVVAVVLYLGWRLVQLVMWLVG